MHHSLRDLRKCRSFIQIHTESKSEISYEGSHVDTALFQGVTDKKKKKVTTVVRDDRRSKFL